MPKFKLPKKKEHKTEPDIATTDSMDYQRRISVPANDEILDALSVDDMVEVTIKGKVIGTRSVSGDYSDKSFEIEAVEVSAYTEKMTEEDFEEGYEE